MPELPEVETIRRDLEKVILNKKITSISIGKKKLIKSDSKKFEENIASHQFKKIDRVGKLLIFHLDKKKFLLIHLKMTGQLIYQQCQRIVAGGHNYPPIDACLPNKFSHVVFTFEDASQLFFNDQRQFGYLKIVGKSELKKITADFGIEPLQDNFQLSSFIKIFTGRSTIIKNILLNQKIIAGIGNIYADEICHDANIRPNKKASSVNTKQIKQLYQSTQKIIKKAIKHRGTTFSDYVDSKGKKGNFSQQLKVYGKEKQICQKCGKTKIKKIKVAGRGTHYCPHCQN